MIYLTSFKHKIAAKFQCPLCHNTWCKPDTFVIKGHKKEELSTFENFDLVSITCSECGYTDFFDQYYIR